MKKKIGLIFAALLICISFGLLNNDTVNAANDGKKTIKINNTTLSFNNIIYVDANSGNDKVADGSSTKAFASVDEAIKKASKGDAIFIKEGKYHLKPMFIDGYSSAGLSDMNKEITIIGENDKTILEFYGKESTSRDGNAFYLTNTNSKVMNLTYNFYPGKGGSYSNAIFVVSNASFHNLFINVKGDIPCSYSYYNNNPKDKPEIYNCVFKLDKEASSDYSGRPHYKNCITNYKFGGGTKENCLVQEFNWKDIKEIQSNKEFADKGLGVYSGEFAWGKIQIGDNTEIKVQSISLDKTSMDLLEGSSDKLNAKVLPEDATNNKVVWASSDESIATVDKDGKVTAIKEGQATITAKVEGTDLTATCKVNVTKKIEENKNNAILSISLVNGATKEYDVSMQEVEKFINWFEERSNGKGPSLYSFDKKINPYKTVKEYIVHDKIASFEVREYEGTNK
ncbi:Ig domain-containing protein [Clostridium botulinum]|uniref:Ig-like domain-containing protein n=2 Tax=Clostridium botulinum TaxID=1491 RepID=UPI0007749D3B|nr:Ig-like domain-containing protein [Clostridium botulinum]NFK37663.1 Ig domain-containing protein [Clostridium botulinum H04402 065]MBD5587085.1 Ig domain-containing protein [Clostridium botulinum]MBO0572473.1 Ig domain-containing protein [Clostridium botulinum]MBO0580930.1 Ig domain-containing protein [Clostridium botulinum]NFB15947.1 Ig domain-containing protein [Clostridium botulinum]